jgi:Glycosyltransferase family 92
MFKDSAEYLEEWLRFHQEVGFDHFYLYDNASEDAFRDVIEPFVSAGQITLHSWPGTARILSAIEHCLETYRDDCRWMVFLDDDEFLFPAEGEHLPEVLSRYDNYAGVTACWLMFGSSGFRARPPGLVISNYRKRASAVNEHGKCIVQPGRVTTPWALGHAFHCPQGESIVDEKFEAIRGLFPENPSSNILCLNHYVSKSLEEMRWRRSRLPACADNFIYTLEQYLAADAGCNEVEDLRIQRFADRLTQGVVARTAGAR